MRINKKCLHSPPSTVSKRIKKMNQKTINKLENLQHLLQRCLLGAANSTPLVAMSWDLGMLSMEHRVNISKLVFLKYLVDQDGENLSKEIFNTQKSLDFPGFIQEVRDLLKIYELPNIIDSELKISYSMWKSKVKKAVKKRWEAELRGNMNTSKLKDGPLVGESFGLKEYINKLQITDARTKFRLRSFTTNVKMNRKSDPTYAAELWKCDGCGNLDTQSHIMWCPGFAPLREGLDVDNDKDVIHYFQEVFKLRESVDEE